MPELPSDSATSVTTATSVGALKLTVPAKPLCSWEQDSVTGGSRNRPFSALTRRAMRLATTVSVISGRKWPCCSKLPTGSTATRAARSCSSREVAVVISGSMGASLPQPDLVWGELLGHVRVGEEVAMARDHCAPHRWETTA